MSRKEPANTSSEIEMSAVAGKELEPSLEALNEHHAVNAACSDKQNSSEPFSEKQNLDRVGVNNRTSLAPDCEATESAAFGQEEMSPWKDNQPRRKDQTRDESSKKDIRWARHEWVELDRRTSEHVRKTKHTLKTRRAYQPQLVGKVKSFLPESEREDLSQSYSRYDDNEEIRFARRPAESAGRYEPVAGEMALDQDSTVKIDGKGSKLDAHQSAVLPDSRTSRFERENQRLDEAFADVSQGTDYFSQAALHRKREDGSDGAPSSPEGTTDDGEEFGSLTKEEVDKMLRELALDDGKM